MAKEIEMAKQEAMMAAEQADQAQMDVLESAAPQGKFTVRGLNMLVQAVNKVLPMFGEDAYPEFSEDVGILPPEFMQVIMMISKAAEDAGFDALQLEGISEDADLTMLAGKISTLADDRAFKRFLKERVGEEEEAPMEPTQDAGELNAEAPAEPEAMAEDDMDFFASRM